MTIPKWEGVYPAMLTPFTKDDTIDFEMFKLNVNAQLDAGVDGLVVGGSLGEASTLLAEEKWELLRYCKTALNRPVPVIVNIAEQSTKAAIQIAKDAVTNGADGLMVLPPMRYKADDRETVEYFKAIAATTDLTIMIYNNPFDYKIEVTSSPTSMSGCGRRRKRPGATSAPTSCSWSSPTRPTRPPWPSGKAIATASTRRP